MIDLKGVGKEFVVYRNVQLHDVLTLADRTDVLSATEGRYTIVQDGSKRNSLDASWHQDGLTYETPPSKVLLYCESTGRGDITTDLADVSSALVKLDDKNREILNELNRYYVSRSGLDIYSGSILRKDENSGAEYLSLCSRGWIRGDLNMTLEKMTRAMFQLFEMLKPVYVHSWREGDCLVFNNLKYVHRRFNSENKPDPQRRLVRIWFE